MRELAPSPRFTAPVTVPPLIVNVSFPPAAMTEPIAPAPLFITRVLLVPSPRSRLPLNEPPLCTVTPSTPVERLRFSMALKAIPSIVPLLAPLITIVLSPVLSVTVSEVLLPPTRFSMPAAVPLMAVAPPAAVLPLVLVISVRVTDTALP